MGLFTKKVKKESPLPNDYLTSVCEIKTMENELISTGLIGEITPEYIQVNKKNDPLVLMKTGDRVKINVFNTKKGFRVMLGTVFTTTHDFLKVVEVQELADHDRRQFFRVNLELTAFVYEKGDLETAKKLPINIRDMSLSGLRIEMDPPPEIGDVIWIELNLNGRAYCCQCRVMRKIPVNNTPDNDVFQYGCAFLFNEMDDTDPLCSFLFKKQGEEIRRIRAAEAKKLG